MNRKQLLIILAVGLVLGGIGLYLNKQKAASFQRTAKTAGDKLLGDFPVNDVAHITLRQHAGEVNLVKGEVWTVKERDNYPASASEIIEFARKLWDLRPAQSQKIGESQLGRLELLPPDKGGSNSATLVELKGKDGKAIRSLLLGKKSMRGGGGNDPFGGGGWPNGRWIYLPDKPGTAYLVPEAFSEIEPKPEQWLNKDFFKVEKVRSVAVTFPNATNSWKLTRETEGGEWKLGDATPEEQLDAGKASGVSNPLSSPGFVDTVIGATPGQTGFDNPTVVALETFDRFNYTVKIGQKTNDNYFLAMSLSADLPKERAPGPDEKPEDKEKLDQEFKDKQKQLAEKLAQEKAFEKWTYLVSGWTVDSLLKERSQLLVEKKEEPKKEDDDKDEKPADEKKDAADPLDPTFPKP